MAHIAKRLPRSASVASPSQRLKPWSCQPSSDSCNASMVRHAGASHVRHAGCLSGTNDGMAAGFHLARHGNGSCVGVASSWSLLAQAKTLPPRAPFTNPTSRIQACRIRWCVASVQFSEPLHAPSQTQAEPIAPTHATQGAQNVANKNLMHATETHEISSQLQKWHHVRPVVPNCKLSLHSSTRPPARFI